MTDTSKTTVTLARTWGSTQAYALATIFLALGIGVGYGAHRSIGRSQSASTGSSMGTSSQNDSGQSVPSLEQMKQMADVKAEPLLQQLKTQPNNAALLAEVAHIYFSTHQFKEANSYYEQSLKLDPKNVGVRADFASCLFYTGETDKSIATLEQALRYDPQSAQALYNLGMIRWKAKGDSASAIALWERLLKNNPNLPDSRRQAVEKAIAEASQQGNPAQR